MKTLAYYTILFFLVLILNGCGGSKDDDQSIIAPDENPIEPINSAPSVPVLIYPSNGLLCIDNQLDFSWEASIDADDDPISYSIQVANDEQFTDIISEITSDETNAVISLEKGKSLFWRALAIDDQNNKSNYSPSWEFYTEGEPIINQLPFPPESIYPNMDEVISASSIVLSWNGSDPDSDALTYDVYIGTVPNAPLVTQNLEESYFEVSLTDSSKYYWSISCKDGAGGVSFSPIWSFTTE